MSADASVRKYWEQYARERGLRGDDVTRYADARLDGLTHAQAIRELLQLKDTPEPEGVRHE